MPVRVTVDRGHRLVISNGWGRVADGDLLAGRRLLAANPEFDPSFDRIWNLTGATALQLSDETLNRFAERSLSAPGVRRAIVCVAPAVVARVLDFVAASRHFNRDVAVFPTLASATAWINSGAEIEAGGSQASNGFFFSSE